MKQPVLKLKLLGQPECKLPSGKLLRLSTRKSEVLLAYLALAPGIRHPRDRLINLLWSDRGEDQARNSLRQSLSSIKKAFESETPDLLQIERTTVKLAANQIQVDVHEFERLQVESTPENLSKAAEIYQGELLEGISIRDTACQEWLGNERGRLRRLIVEVLSSLTQLRLAKSQHMETIASAERLVEYDPLQESSWRLLMTAYYQKGDRNHALMAYKRCRDNLHKELGVEPDTETNDLQERIKQGDLSKPKSLDIPDKQKSEFINANSDSASNNHGIVVLPFDNLSGDAEQEYFSDGITESIILNLSLFPGLSVKSRNSSFAFKQQIKSLGEISKELNVDYVVEGSIRKAVDRIKITVQLIEANSGNHIWGKRYDSGLEDIFDLEEELSRTIAATVTGRIESDLQRIALSKPAAHQQSYDLLLAGKYHLNKITADDLVIAREKFYQCLEIDGNNVQAHVLLYSCHAMDWLERWTENYAESYRLAGEHCEKALVLAPGDLAVQTSYAEFLIFSREHDEAVNHVNRALELNPNDPDSLAVKSYSHTMLGEYEAGVDFGDACMRLDPYHPWGEWNKSEALFYWGHYDEAIETILEANTSPNILPIILIGCYIRKGEVVKARQAMTKFLQSAGESMKSLPGTREEWWQYVYTYSPHRDVSITEKLFEDLLQAGLCDFESEGNTITDQPNPPTIAVLPFDNLSGDPEQEHFSDGLTASIILGLGMFNSLTVKSQQTSFAFKGSTRPSKEIAEELKVQYLVEGNVRKFKSQVRVTVQLVESGTGNQIWGRQYDSRLEDILELDQELSQTIAATISGRLGHKIQHSATQKPDQNLSNFDYLNRGLDHLGKFTPGDLKMAREQFQQCINIDPGNAVAHVNLAMTHMMDLYECWSTDKEQTRILSGQHMEKALEFAPDSAVIHAYLSDYLVSVREYDRAEFHADKAIELNPTAAEGYAVKADLLTLAGRSEEALKYAEQCFQLDPHSTGSAWAAGVVYRDNGQYQQAIKAFRSIHHIPNSVRGQIAACLAGLNQIDQAKSEMARYHEIAREQMPNYPNTREEWRDTWYETTPYQHDDDFDTLFQLLLKAGLCD